MIKNIFYDLYPGVGNQLFSSFIIHTLSLLIGIFAL